MKKHLIIGLGQTGLSILAFLQRHNQAAIGFDTRTDLPQLNVSADFKYYLGDLPTAVWQEIDKVIISPGVDPNHPVILKAQRLGLPLIGDIELFYHEAKAPIIAITGTNAKSTVTTLVTEMLNAAGKKALMGGNIGIAALDLLSHPTPDFYVLELSSFQLDLVQDFKALIGCVLNISADHLDRHGTMTHYQRTKERIYQNATHIITNRALEYLQLYPNLLSFGLSLPATEHDWGVAHQREETWIMRGNTPVFNTAELSQGLSGAHNLENALSALAILAPLHLPLEPQLEILRHFKSLPHRCVFVRQVHGVDWYNDSKGTNVGATLAAIKGIAAKTSGKLIVLLGGVGKDQDFKPLQAALKQHARSVIVYGQDRKAIMADLEGLGCIDHGNHFEAALLEAQTQAQPGDTVLFSPACASLDLFKNYADRGEQFTAWVNKIE
jgi:UDP-N-acetylmuramoylalanine--D-glutamate ligase